MGTKEKCKGKVESIGFTKEQKARIGELRGKGWAIKKIARAMHVSDKRVSAYLLCEKGLSKAVKTEKKTAKVTKGEAKKVAKKPEVKKETEGGDDCIIIKVTARDKADDKKLASFLEYAAKKSDEAASKFISTLSDGMLSFINRALSREKFTSADTEKFVGGILDRCTDSFLDAAFSVGTAAQWFAPSTIKKLWVDTVGVDPRVFHKEQDGKCEAKCGKSAKCPKKSSK